METKIINFSEIEKDNILSPEYYLKVKPLLKKWFSETKSFKNPLTKETYYTELTFLDKLNYMEKLYFYDLILKLERYKKVFEILKGGLN